MPMPDYRFDNVVETLSTNFPTNSQQPYLNLPALPFPYFWQIEVGMTFLHLQIKKREWFWPFRPGHIENKASEAFAHDGTITQALLDNMSDIGAKMAKVSDPKREIRKGLKKVKFNVPVRVVKG